MKGGRAKEIAVNKRAMLMVAGINNAMYFFPGFNSSFAICPSKTPNAKAPAVIKETNTELNTPILYDPSGLTHQLPVSPHQHKDHKPRNKNLPR